MTVYRDANDPNDPDDLEEFEPNRRTMQYAACTIMFLLALGIAAVIAAVLS